MGMFNDPPLEPWEKARADAYEALNQAEKLHRSIHAMLWRIDQHAINHREPAHSEDGKSRRPSLGEEEIQRDEVRREAERGMSLEASFGRAIKEALTLLGGKKP